MAGDAAAAAVYARRPAVDHGAPGVEVDDQPGTADAVILAVEADVLRNYLEAKTRVLQAGRQS